MRAGMQRVVSLLPSATEIVAALGAADRLVGVSHECDFPEAVRTRPLLTRARLEDSGSSQRIDREVRDLATHALSIYAVDAEGLRAADPDIIITQDLCEVCAVSLDDVRSAVARLAYRSDIEILALSPTRLGDVLDDVERVAQALGLVDQGQRLRSTLNARIAAIEARSAAVGRRPRVASVEWLDPLMLGGTWMPDLIEAAGGTPVAVTAGAAAPTVSLFDLAALEPDVVLLKPCGFTVARALQERDTLAAIRAAMGSDTRVILTDGNAYFNRPGPRLVDSIEIMAACVHPEVFSDFIETHRDAMVAIEGPGQR